MGFVCFVLFLFSSVYFVLAILPLFVWLSVSLFFFSVFSFLFLSVLFFCFFLYFSFSLFFHSSFFSFFSFFLFLYLFDCLFVVVFSFSLGSPEIIVMVSWKQSINQNQINSFSLDCFWFKTLWYRFVTVVSSTLDVRQCVPWNSVNLPLNPNRTLLCTPPTPPRPTDS